jgi:hypothetical protein
MSAGLDASTVTPGSTAPDVSRTVPVMDAWANTLGAAIKNNPRARHAGPGVMRITLPPILVTSSRQRDCDRGMAAPRHKKTSTSSVRFCQSEGILMIVAGAVK